MRMRCPTPWREIKMSNTLEVLDIWAERREIKVLDIRGRQKILFIILTAILFFTSSCVTVEQIYQIQPLEEYTCEDFKEIVSRMIETPDDFRVVMQEYGMIEEGNLEHCSNSEVIRRLELIKEYGGYPDICNKSIFKSAETYLNTLRVNVFVTSNHPQWEQTVRHDHFMFYVEEKGNFYFYGIYRNDP
jgi:hypothetical protein